MAMKRFCSVFNCDKKRESRCCFYCEDRKKCSRPCANHPEECGLLKLTIAFEEFMEYILPRLNSKGKFIRLDLLEQEVRDLIAKEIVTKDETGEIQFHSEKLPGHYQSICNGKYKRIRLIKNACLGR